MALVDNNMFLELLPNIEVNNYDLNIQSLIGIGDESFVYNHNDTYALKIFKDANYINDNVLKNKFAKIFILSRYSDKSFCFPIGIVKINGINSGYYMDYIDSDKTFNYLNELKDLRDIIKYLINASEAIKRIHKKGFIIGDIKQNNILLTKDNKIKFVDTDNYSFNGFDFDIRPVRANTMKRLYNKDFDPIDNDIFVYSLLALRYITNKYISQITPDMSFINELIKSLNINSEAKDILESIFSDSKNKPYIDQALRLINPNEIKPRL